ncbi:Mg2+ transporter protein CorA-like/Zinc transport protein ZntB protein [Dioscorea alata]|nr:Mg2+ transporter protein CorA-like/Zinc transport protein ZntB protein [Dioscorea alata]
MSDAVDGQSSSSGDRMKKQEVSKFPLSKDSALGCDLWTDGLICAFEFIRGHRLTHKSGTRVMQHRDKQDRNKQTYRSGLSNVSAQTIKGNSLPESTSLIDLNNSTTISDSDEIVHPDENKENHKHVKDLSHSHWIPIGWARISELVQMVQTDASWNSCQIDFTDEEDDITVADVAAPYWERPVGPTWWCHVHPGHSYVEAWLNHAQWLHPAISTALRDESRLISERMKHLLYEVPVRVAGGLLFELLGQSVGDPFRDEDDIPIVLRSWQAQNFLITAMHIKGSASNINVLGITEVQELLLAGGSTAPKSVHEVIAHLTSRLARWDDRLFRKYVFGAADEIELKFVNRRSHEDLNLLSIILNQEIKRLATQVIRVKWSLHAREEIVFELIQHLRGNATKVLLEGTKKNTREMLEEQEAVRGRLFTIQDVMQSTVRAWLQDRSLRVTHNLAVFGGCGLVLSIITGLFGINVDGIPGAANTPYAFGLFTAILFFIGIVLICLGMLYLGLRNPITEERVNIRKLELQQLVSTFQHDAETHAKVRQGVSRHNLPPTAADMIAETG